MDSKEYQRTYRQSYREGQQQAGLCVDGDHPAEPGSTRCKKCAAAVAARVKSYRERKAREEAGALPLHE